MSKDNIINILSKTENRKIQQLSIDVLDLSTRLRHTLLKYGVDTIDDMVNNWSILPSFGNMGTLDIVEITDKLNILYQKENPQPPMRTSENPAPNLQSFPVRSLIYKKATVKTKPQTEKKTPDVKQPPYLEIDKKLFTQNDSLSTIPIEDLDLPIRVYNSLKRNNINTVYQLCNEWEDLRLIWNVGSQTYRDIHAALITLQNSILSTKIDDEPIIPNEEPKESEFFTQDLPENENNPTLQVPIEALGLSPRVEHTLHRNGINTVNDVVNNLKIIPSFINMGDKSISEIIKKVTLWQKSDEERGKVYSDITTSKRSIPPSKEMNLDEFFSLLFEELQPRSISIIEYRYGLRSGDRATLEETSKHFEVTRERIRQIESQALKKLNSKFYRLGQSLLIIKIQEMIDTRGGLISESRLMEELQNTFIDTDYSLEGIMELVIKLTGGEITLNKGEEKILNIKRLYGWSTSHYNNYQILRASDKIIEILSNAKSPIQWEKLISILTCQDGLLTLSESLAHAIILCLSDNQQIQRQMDGSWSKIERNTRYKRIISVLQQIGRPSHFSEISELYNQIYTDLPQSDHNIHAVISGRDEFVRVGRGKYGLAEWGMHDDGNVANAVRRILIDNKHPMHFVDISEEVIKTWDVKKSAIVAAIENDARFSKTNDGRIWLTETGLTIKRKIKRDDDTRWDRLLVVLRKLGAPQPVHLIVEAHNSSHPERPLTPAAVRYMMYRKPELFTHIGSNEFGLKEWGLQSAPQITVNRAEEIYNLLQQCPPLHVREIHKKYNEAHPEKPASLVSIALDLKKLAGRISSPKRGIYTISDAHVEREHPIFHS